MGKAGFFHHVDLNLGDPAWVGWKCCFCNRHYRYNMNGVKFTDQWVCVLKFKEKNIMFHDTCLTNRKLSYKYDCQNQSLYDVDIEVQYAEIVKRFKETGIL